MEDTTAEVESTVKTDDIQKADKKDEEEDLDVVSALDCFSQFVLLV